MRKGGEGIVSKTSERDEKPRDSREVRLVKASEETEKRWLESRPERGRKWNEGKKKKKREFVVLKTFFQ